MKHNSNHEKQIFIPNGQGWRCCSKKISALSKKITWKHDCGFYGLNFLYSLITKNKFESRKKVCDNKEFCVVVMSSEDTRTLEFNQYWKSDQTPYITYVDLESLIKKIYGCNNNFERSSTAKVGEHIFCGYSVSTIWTCDGIENQHDVCRGENCMKKFCECFRIHTIKIINFEKKKTIPLTNEQQELYEKTKIYYISIKKFEHKYTNDKNYRKVRDHCYYIGKYRRDTYSICNLKYSIPKEIHVVFHNGLN